MIDYEPSRGAVEEMRLSYGEGIDAVLNYIGCLHPETKLEDVIQSVQDAWERGII